MRTFCTILAFLALAGAAEAYEVNHPVFPSSVSPARAAELRDGCERVLNMGEAELDGFIVHRTTHDNIICPNCRAGNRNRPDHLTWTPDEPDHLKCRYCGMLFPNEKYPLDKVLEVTDSTGQVQRLRYWEGPDGYRYFLDVKIENCKKTYMEGKAQDLADLYLATKDPKWARRSALILLKLAEAYPHYCVHGISDWNLFKPMIWPVQPVPLDPDGVQPVPAPFGDEARQVKTPYPYCSTRRGDGADNWFYAEMPPGLALAYDHIVPSGEVAALGKERGQDVGRAIERFLRATANFSRTYPRYLGNMDPWLIRGLAIIGRCIGEPEFVHDAVIRLKLVLAYRFYADGLWSEGAPSYHRQAMDGFRSCLTYLEGYTDPDGYTGIEDGLHFADLSLAKDVPALTQAREAVGKLVLPNGSDVTVHDTWAATTLGRAPGALSSQEQHPRLLWAYGHAVLARGAGMQATQAHLHFSGAYGHSHYDTLNLTLYAGGRELLSDIGYTHTVLRPWAVGSLAHNLVVVDGQDRAPEGQLLAYAPADNTVQLAEAGVRPPLPPPTSGGNGMQSRRALALVATPDGGSYAVDVYRVQGGRRHEWVLHGSADEEQALTPGLPVTPQESTLLPPGDTFRPWAGEGGRNVADGRNNSYGLFRDLRSASGDAAWQAEFACTGAPAGGLRVFALGQPGTRLFFGEVPSVRRAREDSAKVMEYWMPAIVARREGESLSSVFAAVYDPHAGPAHVHSVEALPAPAGSGIVALKVTGDGWTDTHFFGPGKLAAAGIGFSGRYGFVRVRGGVEEHALLVDGEELSAGKAALKPAPAPAGEVLATRSRARGDAADALVVSGALPAGSVKPGDFVWVQFSPEECYALEADGMRPGPDGGTLILLRHVPGFEVAGERTTLTHHPHKSWDRRPRLRVPAVTPWPQSDVQTH